MLFLFLPNAAVFFTLAGHLKRKRSHPSAANTHGVLATIHPLEWVPIYATAIAVGFLTVTLVMRVSRRFIDSCGPILLLEAAVGLWGFILHFERNMQGPSTHLFDNLVYLAPPMAPLLFPNLMVLGVIALWRLRSSLA